MVLGALLSAFYVTGTPLKDQRIVIFGPGSAGLGVAEVARADMVQQGVTDETAPRHLWRVNRGGLLYSERTDLKVEQRRNARPWVEVALRVGNDPQRASLAEVVREVRPTILIGLSPVAGAFDEPRVRQMSTAVARPIIFPVSNPITKSEAVPKDLLRWTDGRGLVAMGSPFVVTDFDGRSVPIAQCNNAYVFPALGLGAVASQARRVTDGMMLAAAHALADRSPARQDASAPCRLGSRNFAPWPWRLPRPWTSKPSGRVTRPRRAAGPRDRHAMDPDLSEI